MIRGFTQVRKSVPIPSPIDLRGLINEHNSLLKTVEEKRNALQKLHDDATQMHKEASGAHRDFIASVEAKLSHLNALLEEAMVIKKGDKGDKPIAGVDYPIPKDGQGIVHNEVVTDVLKKIRQPKDGETPIIDYKKVAKLAVQLIPKTKEKTMDEGSIVQKVLESIRTGKKLNIKDIPGFSEGLEQTIAPIRSLAAGFRGGGDVVTAGSNITITTDVNGKKVIAGTAGGLSVLSATGTIDNSNTVFTFTKTPTLVVVNGTSYRDGHGVSIVGTTATLDNPVGTGGDIYALGS